MFIQTEETPNPAALKFIPGVDVMGTGNAGNLILRKKLRIPHSQNAYSISMGCNLFF
ncbi:MAG: hypothetical protein CM15mP117_11120 [Alphaproteobacteria bacterium]|nr:MAG: hypothetical protein CM15mP117_11120 [Alphaproteobacteria bacterium]